MNSYMNMGTVAMAILNLIALCVIEDPPYFQLIFYENLRKSESDCKCIDLSSNSCHSVKKNAITKYYCLCGLLYIINKCIFIVSDIKKTRHQQNNIPVFDFHEKTIFSSVVG
jgi:hypothetical protein